MSTEPAAPEANGSQACIWPPTDLGNAERLAHRHARDLRYLVDEGTWLSWDGRRFTPDLTGEIERRAIETVRSIPEEAERALDERARADLLNHAQRSESASRLSAMVRLARCQPAVPVRREELDADPFLLNTSNGIIDLRTGEVMGHDRRLLLSHLAPVNFDPSATAPTWKRFVESITGSSPDLSRFLQRAVGYFLTGVTTEQVLVLFIGSGANGKTTFLETLRAMLGDYVRQAEFSSFLRGRRGAVRNDLARLAGARLVTASEVEEGRRLDEALVKAITGGDQITARLLFREFTEFQPTFKIALAMNHAPELRGTDHALWRRIMVVPFPVQIADKDQDPHLRDRLRAELPGILAWAVEGCLEWRRVGLAPPREVREATAAYRAESDQAGRFLEERCEMAEQASVQSVDLYAAYTAWCAESGEKPVSRKALGARLTERHLERRRLGSPRKAWTWVGVRLRSGASAR